MSEIYLDNSATTKISKEALSAVLEAYENFGNPSSRHSIGASASKKIRAAGDTVLSLLSKDRNSGIILFTSGGTEANNLAILGGFYSKKRHDSDIVMITDSEHASVEMAAKELEKKGYRVLRVPTKGGSLDIDFIKANLNSSIVMASFMSVNNETGAHYDVAEAFALIKRFDPSIITHTDAVQAFGKIPLSAEKMKADMITISAHKIHGPMGVGALYVNRETLKTRRITPIVYGGGQQSAFRSGTENVPGILGFAAACEYLKSHLLPDAEAMNALRTYASEKLSTLDVKQNIPEKAAPHILNITLPGIKSEVMLHFLSSKGIYVSSGSACSSNHPTTSRPLIAFGLSEFDADCSIRISFGKNNTESDVDALVLALDEGIRTLVKRKK